MRRQSLLSLSLCLLLAGITLALYWPTAHFNLIYFDDPIFVTDTPEINHGLNWNSLVFAFTNLLAANWHPVTNLTFLLTHQFAAPNPGLEHLVNAAFHAASAALLFLLLFRLTGATWRSAAAAALFAWHPLRVESVAWIAERKDVVSVFFFLLTLLAYAKYAEKSKARSPGAKKFFYLSLLWFALGLMGKSMLVTTPFVLLLLDLWPLKRLEFPVLSKSSPSGLAAWRQLAWEKWPFFGLTLAFSIATYLSQRHGAAVPFDRLDVPTRAANIIESYLRYLGKMVWPHDLALLYPYPHNDNSYLAFWPDGQLLAGATALVLISILCLRVARTRPYLAVGWLWFLGTLLPVIGLIQVGGQAMADRYTYLPMIGPVVALVWLVADLTRPALQKIALIPVSIFVLAGCLWGTRQQLEYWHDTIRLFSHTVDVTGDNGLAQLILGDGYDHAGIPRAALVHYRIAAALVPNSPESFQELGRLLLDQQDWDEAAANFRTVLSLNPNETTAYLGLVKAQLQLGQTADVIDTLKKAVAVSPDSPGILNNLAWMLATTGDPSLRDGALAVQFAERACQLTHHQQTLMLGTLAAAYAEAGRFPEAVATATEATEQARKNGDDQAMQRNQDLLGLYQKGQAFHDRESLVPPAK